MNPRVPRAILRPVVLVYHGVAEVPPGDDPTHLVLHPDAFDEHLALLSGLGYRFAPASELAAHPERRPARGTATLCFDDGLRDGLTEVVPRLRTYGIPATFFVSTGVLGGRHHEVQGASGALMDADDLRALVAAGMDVGSHAVSHRDLRRLDDATLDRELRASKACLEAITGRPCTTLAYPFGLSDERVQAAAAAAGYALAFGWLPGRWRRFDAPRLPAPHRHGARRLAVKLTGLRRPGR